MKIVVIGGGSTYTPELVSGLLGMHPSLPVTELWLMDTDVERLEIVGGFAQRIVAKHGHPFKIELTDQRVEAIREAAFIITQIRVGGMDARREDEYLGRRHGLIGQETTGVGGISKALRTIPIVLEIAREVTEHAPSALLANFTNPAGLITEALHRHVPNVKSVGICNVPITTKMTLLDMLEETDGLRADPDEAFLDTLGLNHLSWHRGLKVHGADYWPKVIEATLRKLENNTDGEWPARLIKALGMIPNYYLGYYYNTKKKIAAQKAWPPSRAEEVMQIEAALLQEYADPGVVEVPEQLMQRGGAYYSTVAARLLNAIHNDLNEVQILNAPHRGAVAEWPTDWVLELPCKVNKAGVHPLIADPLPLSCYALLCQVKASELLTIEAAVQGDRSSAYQAILTHPLGPDADQAEAVLSDILQIHRDTLPQFWD